MFNAENLYPQLENLYPQLVSCALLPYVITRTVPWAVWSKFVERMALRM